MATRVLAVTPASAESFRRFGVFVAAAEGAPIPEGSAFSYKEKVGVMATRGSTSVGILRAVGRSPEFHEMERHVATPEMLVALEGDVLVPVAPANHPAEAADARAIEVFRLRQGEAVILDPGVWHWLPYPLSPEAAVLVVFKEGTPDHDFTLCDLQATQGVTLTMESNTQLPEEA